MNSKQTQLIKKIKYFDFIGEKGDYDNHVAMEDISVVYEGAKVKDAKDITLSIIIPTMNRPLLLKEAIESALNQNTDVDFEIVILNNEGLIEGGNSKTDDIILTMNSDRVMYYKNKSTVISADNWNTLLFLARGKWICMLHDDDVLAPNAVQMLYDATRMNKKISFVGCINVPFSGEERVEADLRSIKVKKVSATEFMYGMPVSLLGAFFDRKKAIEIGGFENRSYMQDYSFIAKYAHVFDMYLLKRGLYGYRISDVQDSANNEMNFVRRVADYYLWLSIAKRRGMLRRLFEKNCQYNIVHRIEWYNSDTKYEGNYIDLNELLDVCEINKKKLHSYEYMLMKGLHGLVIIKDKLLNIITQGRC
ncbi:MAG: glycosyltransferase family 2 protein [Lachnospiraceae bacterium]|nr:glycosyltransferase family 2 protein [Lachnospiraceae bacterium]